MGRQDETERVLLVIHAGGLHQAGSHLGKDGESKFSQAENKPDTKDCD